jgi:hypothetical protein
LILRFQTTWPHAQEYRIFMRFYAMRGVNLDEELIFVPGSLVSADPDAPIGAGLAEPPQRGRVSWCGQRALMPLSARADRRRGSSG